ncbi:glycoprotein 3-alpha-L-fucosyltransferase A-like [Montipora capricornis]|uniref:glycoprotein 3-alpha-L-fucosyltransferase A-like n=1 Tax=Montipora foliosa TaxID=591990 RepID=UPI0035F15CCF
MKFHWQKSIKNSSFRGCPTHYIIFVCVGVCCVFYSSLFKNVFLFDKTYFLNKSVGARVSRQQPSSSKLILLFTPFFGEKWTDHSTLGPSRTFFTEGRQTFKDCEVSTCVVTYNKGKLLQADAVGFHARDMPAVLPKQRTSKQVWFYFVLENPLNVVMNANGYENVFNWTMSYSRDSEIYTPYGKYILSSKLASDEFDNDDITLKDKKVAWLVSNCHATERKEYVEELKKYIDVSIYGQCGDSKSCPAKRHSPICKALLRRHKFYLAFENGNCPEYITEKYWENSIDNNIVPVVMGGADYKALVIPNSFIDVQDFDSPKKLADYLLYLDRNDTEYKKYFRWKKFYQHVPPKFACSLCKQLHNRSLLKSPRVYQNMAMFWDTDKCRKLNLLE